MAADEESEISSLQFYRHCNATIGGVEVICARTGYTGELGYELYIEGEGADRVWTALSEQEVDFEVKPVGLGARDTLRMEMKYCLYGNDIDEGTNPLEANLEPWWETSPAEPIPLPWGSLSGWHMWNRTARLSGKS